MSEHRTWLHAKAAGMDLLIATSDLREVVASAPVSPLPGRPAGIAGVVVYEGEFLPVLAWDELPGCVAPPGRPQALAVLRPRLGIPLERLVGTTDLPHGILREPEESDPALPWLGGVAHEEGQVFRLLDADRLVALLRRFRGEH
ncbi:MAG: chemotaxis protein CheW [Acidobacteria bacterium]|nr:chemotaxis protein CheW [Acidobacteriota bacterium]MBI3487504.1 chemotaxis protein CheW [Acidobacteriota bacterium]